MCIQPITTCRFGLGVSDVVLLPLTLQLEGSLYIQILVSSTPPVVPVLVQCMDLPLSNGSLIHLKKYNNANTCYVRGPCFPLYLHFFTEASLLSFPISLLDLKDWQI